MLIWITFEKKLKVPFWQKYVNVRIYCSQSTLLSWDRDFFENSIWKFDEFEPDWQIWSLELAFVVTETVYTEVTLVRPIDHFIKDVRWIQDLITVRILILLLGSTDWLIQFQVRLFFVAAFIELKVQVHRVLFLIFLEKIGCL